MTDGLARSAGSVDPHRRGALLTAAGVTLGWLASSRDADGSRRHAAGFRRSEWHAGDATAGAQGRRLFVWYPAVAGEKRFDYGGPIGRVAAGAPPAPGRHPLLVFSHGYLGAGDQSIFLTEHLSRMGYIVAAVDHADAQGRAGIGGVTAFARPQDWIAETYIDRRQDMTALIDLLVAADADRSAFLHRHVDDGRIGAIGHSLGGYTVLGLAGARTAWREPRVRAALGLSPYVAPYLQPHAEVSVPVPVMLQGGTLDFGITPDLPAMFERLHAGRYLMVLRGENHLGWTNLASIGRDTVAAVAQGNPRWIADYALAFFDRHLRERDRSDLLDRPNAELHSYLHESPTRR